MGKVFTILLFILVCAILLEGCKKQESIHFYRQSDSFMESVKNAQNGKHKSVVIDKKGVVIYKDNSLTDKSDGGAKNFIIGPKDLDFDFNINFLK